jgi:hypothetical protein
MFETRIKDLSELPDLSTMKCEEYGLPKNWGFSYGHSELEENQWAIKHVHEDMSEDLYPLPLWVSVLINWQRKHEREDLQRLARQLFGLDD